MLDHAFGAMVPIGTGREAFVVVVPRNGDGENGVGVARHVATVAAVQLAEQYRQDEELLRRSGELLTSILANDLSMESARAGLAAHGLDANDPLHLAAVRPQGKGPVDSRIVRAALRDLGVNSLVSAAGDCVLMIVGAPLDEGFNRLAWLFPWSVGAGAALAVGFVAIRWSRHHEPEEPAAASTDPELNERLDDELRNLD